MRPTNDAGTIAHVSGGGCDAVTRSIAQTAHAEDFRGIVLVHNTPDANDNVRSALGEGFASGVTEITGARPIEIRSGRE